MHEVEPPPAVNEIFSKRYKIRYPSHEDNGPDTPQRATAEISIQSREPKDIYKIVETAYEWCGGSVAGIQRELREHDLVFSRRKISKMLDSLNFGRVIKN
jgi:hypothetical protein